LKWSVAFRLYIGSFPCAQLPGQEDQLMLTNRATRLEVNEGHQTVAFHMLGIVSSCVVVTLSLRRFDDIRLQKMS